MLELNREIIFSIKQALAKLPFMPALELTPKSPVQVKVPLI